MSEFSSNPTRDSSSSFVMPEVTQDITTNEAAITDCSMDSQWSVVHNPQFSVHNFHVQPLPYESSEVFNPLYDATNRERTAYRTDRGTPLDEFTGLYGFEHLDASQNHSNGSMPSKITSNVESEHPSSNSQTLWYDNASSQNHFSLPLEASRREHFNASESIGNHMHVKDDSEIEQNDKISNSVKSIWNNFKNGFTLQLKTDFKYDSPIWLLGNFYHCCREDREEQKRAHSRGHAFRTKMDEFRIDFNSRLWFTYRKGFTSLPQSNLTSDMGWGCMLRSGQMMMAHALVLHLLGREWRYQIQRKNEDLIYYHKIVQYFADINSLDCPFSIHKLVEMGAGQGKKPGDWFGPASVAHALSKAMIEASPRHILLANLCVYVAQDCTVYLQDIIDLCTKEPERELSESDMPQPSVGSRSSTSSGEEESPWRACVILIPVRLGGIELNDVYIPCLKNLLAYTNCLGIIGGKPKHSLYFVGWQEDKAIYLDPHCCQELVDPRRKDVSLETFHCNNPRKMSFSKLDPSCTVGFYCRTRQEFERFVDDTKKMVFPPLEKQPYPMFVFQEGRGISPTQEDAMPPQRDRVLKVRHFDKDGRPRPVRDSDDFVFLEA